MSAARGEQEIPRNAKDVHLSSCYVHDNVNSVHLSMFVEGSSREASVEEQQGGASRRRGPEAQHSLWFNAPDTDGALRRTLTRERVVAEALTLIAQEGVEALTMRALSARLEVVPGALYRHVRSKEQLQDLVVDGVLAEADCDINRALPWTEQVTVLAHRLRKVLEDHPGVAGLLKTRDPLGPHSLALAEAFLLPLHTAGFPHREAGLAFFLIVDYTIGFEVSSPRISVNEQRVQNAAIRKQLHEFFRSLPGDRFHPDRPRRARLARQPRRAIRRRHQHARQRPEASPAPTTQLTGRTPWNPCDVSTGRCSCSLSVGTRVVSRRRREDVKMPETPRAPGATMTTADGGHTLLPWLREMRDEHPVWRDGHGVWHVFRYADVARVISDPQVFSSAVGRVLPVTQRLSAGNLLQTDPPRHHTLRRLVGAALRPKVVTGLAPRIAELTRELLDATGGAAEFDLVPALAYPLPVIVIAELLGLPAADRGLFRTWADKLLTLDADGPNDPELARKVDEATEELLAYLHEHCQDRRGHPRDDLISKLATVEAEGQRLTNEEVVNFSLVLLLAGHITTTALLGNTVLCLDVHPEVWAELHADRSLVPAALEEVLRYRSPFTQLPPGDHGRDRAGRAGHPGGYARLAVAAVGQPRRSRVPRPRPVRHPPPRQPPPGLRSRHPLLHRPAAGPRGRQNRPWRAARPLHRDPPHPRGPVGVLRPGRLRRPKHPRNRAIHVNRTVSWMLVHPPWGLRHVLELLALRLLRESQHEDKREQRECRVEAVR